MNLLPGPRGKVLRVSVPNDENNRWVSYPELEEVAFSGTDSLYVHNVLPLYFRSMRLAKTNNNYQEADELLESLKGFNNGTANVMLSAEKINAEIFYKNMTFSKNYFVGTFM